MKFEELEQQTSLRERLASLLRNAIFSGALKPGERIVETQLARDMHVGQASIREALQDLEHEGLITRISKRGCRVTDLSLEDITRLYDVRTELEVLAVSKVPSHRLPELGKTLEVALAQMKEAESNGDIGKYSRADYEFHRAIWSSSENPFLVKALDAVTIPLWAFSVIYFHRYQAHKGVDPADRELHRQMLNIVIAKSSAEEKAAGIRKILEAFRQAAERYFRLHQQNGFETFASTETGVGTGGKTSINGPGLETLSLAGVNS